MRDHSRRPAEKAGILRPNGTYGLGVLTADLDNDGWPDIYVANDSTASALYQTKKTHLHRHRHGSRLRSQRRRKPQAGMGISAADYDLTHLISSKRILPATRPRFIAILAMQILRTPLFQAASASTPSISAGAAAFSTWTTTVGDILSAMATSTGSRATQNRGGLRAAQTALQESPQRRFAMSPMTPHGHLHSRRPRGCAFGDFDNDGDLDSLSTPSTIFPSFCAAIHAPATIGSRSKPSHKIQSQRHRRAHQMRHASPRREELHRKSTNPQRRRLISSERSAVHFASAKRKASRSSKSAASGLVETLKDIKPNQVIFVKEGEASSEQCNSTAKAQQAREVGSRRKCIPKAQNIHLAAALAVSLAFAAPATDLPFGAWTRASNSHPFSTGAAWESAGTLTRRCFSQRKIRDAVPRAGRLCTRAWVTLKVPMEFTSGAACTPPIAGNRVRKRRRRRRPSPPEIRRHLVLTYTGYNKKDAQLCLATSRDLIHGSAGVILLPTKEIGTSRDQIRSHCPGKIDGKYWMYWLALLPKTDQMGSLTLPISFMDRSDHHARLPAAPNVRFARCRARSPRSSPSVASSWSTMR